MKIPAVTLERNSMHKGRHVMRIDGNKGFKNLVFLLAFGVLSLPLFTQVQQHEVTVTNVGVQVRVLDGNTFVNNLAKDDFEIYEDGMPQKIEALYLVKKANVERKDALREFNPNLSRNFFLLFQLLDYSPKLDEAIDYLFQQVLLPNDSLTIWTPVQKYNLSSTALQKIPKEKIAKEMKSILRKDTKMGLSQYNSMLNDLKRLVRSMSSTAGFGDQSNVMADIESESTSDAFSLEFLLPKYRETLEKMDDLRVFDEKMFIKFAEVLKKQEGENYVFYFYQREFRPEINPGILNKMTSIYQDNPNILGLLQDLFQFYHRHIQIDVNRIKETFADSSLVFNFIFMNKDPELISGVHMREQSEDVFKALSEAAKATGGIIDNSQNPAHGFKNALEASEEYYLLYYSPADYVKDGKFKSIGVKVKDKDYRIIHRVGYYAN